MSNVNTSDLLNFQDYSPEHNDRSARIDVEAVHTNQYNNTMTNPNYTYEEPTVNEEPEATPSQSNHNFWTIEYYQKYFDVHTNEVVERIVSSVLPQKVSRNYFDERIKGKPDLYGPIWISVTLNTNKAVHWRYDFHLVSYAATAIVCYVWLVPLALWAALKVTTQPEAQDEIEIQNTNKAVHWRYDFHLVSYAATAIVSYVWLVPLALWAALKVTTQPEAQDEIEIQVTWLQWLFVLMAAFVSGAVLIFWLMPALRKSRYFLVLVGSILAFHFLLAAGFMLYFFHAPSSDPESVVLTTIKP
ncbi:Protein YIPF1 [Operophtera brumata]|uniref:Protein YIPF1 n=1 Tax=Operophtera brumata TaxID=104452 RepID=A0A0L7LLL3_OPEBR|nr:Protein YIPF1 [Operophtera brumata]